MKRKFTKTLAMLLIIITAFAMTGCGKTGDEKKKDNSVVNPTSAPTSNEDAADNSETAKTMADFDKESGFKYFNIATGVETDLLNNSPSALLVKDHTGYDVTYDQAPADAVDSQTAITNIFMLKSDYQAVKVSKDQFYTLLEMDALYDITEFVGATTNMKEVISSFGWETATKDGKIYAIPQKNARLANNTAIAYRLDWLKEYNEANPNTQITVPSAENNYSMTLSDYKTMLTFFATKVPQGGKAMGVDMGGVYIENILTAFGIYQDWADVNGQLEYIINQPGFTEYMNYMEDLFDNDLIIYQATSNDVGAVKALQSRTVGAGRVAHWNAFTIESSETAATDENISYIAALIPDDKKGDPSAVRVYASEGYSYYTVIPKYATAEQAAAVIDWADKKFEKEFFLKLALGTEGETFEMKDGEYYPILPAFDEKQGIADKFMDGIREADYAEQWLCRTRKSEAQNKMFSIANYNINQTGIQNPISVMPPNTDYDTYYSACNAAVKDSLVTSLYQTSISKSLDEIKALFVSSEGNTITTSVNNWYKSWELKSTFNKVLPR